MPLLGSPGLGSRLQGELGLRHLHLVPCGPGDMIFSSQMTGIQKTRPHKHTETLCSPRVHPHPIGQRKSLDQAQQCCHGEIKLPDRGALKTQEVKGTMYNPVLWE